jgi:hypothetical protein
MDWVGWGGLTPNEQVAAIYGGATSLGVVMLRKAMFGGLARKWAKARKKKAKRRKAKPKGRR